MVYLSPKILLIFAKARLVRNFGESSFFLNLRHFALIGLDLFSIKYFKACSEILQESFILVLLDRFSQNIEKLGYSLIYGKTFAYLIVSSDWSIQSSFKLSLEFTNLKFRRMKFWRGAGTLISGIVWNI